MAYDIPAVARLETGIRLRQMRTDLGLTVEEVAARLLCSQSAVSRMETGTRRPSLRDVRDMCHLYGADAATTAGLMELAQAARQRDPWAQPAADSTRTGLHVSLEQAAATITAYTAAFIPPLLQAPAYTETSSRNLFPSPRDRQRILACGNPPQCCFLLDEAVLHRQAGTPAVMAAQMGHLLTAAELPPVTIQVVPYTAGPAVAVVSNFTILEFATLPPVVFSEQIDGHTEHTGSLDAYQELAGKLRDQALTAGESPTRILAARDKYATS